MKTLLIAALLALAAAMPAKAETGWILVYTNYQPFYTEVVGGPFQTWRECSAIEAQESYRPGGSYSCRVTYY